MSVFESQTHTPEQEAAPADANSARQRAAERVEAAKKAEEGVNEFYAASDDLARAEEIRSDASERRVVALGKMRDAGMRMAEISEMTGLSTSRIRAIIG